MNTEGKKIVYGVFIFRRDGNHMSILETESYDKAFERWQELEQKWTETIEAKKPFSITDPIVTAFDPGLIVEINLKPVVETSANNYENPYKQNMIKNGLSNSLNSPSSDILDGGYR